MAGKNGYTAAQFIKAIPGTGGIISEIADRVGCSWITAKKYIYEFSTVQEAYQEECNRVTDKARGNVKRAIDRGDLQTSKWWLQVKDPEFTPTSKHEHTGADGGPIKLIEVVKDYGNTE